jgi:hypothetical protein
VTEITCALRFPRVVGVDAELGAEVLVELHPSAIAPPISNPARTHHRRAMHVMVTGIVNHSMSSWSSHAAYWDSLMRSTPSTTPTSSRLFVTHVPFREGPDDDRAHQGANDPCNPLPRLVVNAPFNLKQSDPGMPTSRHETTATRRAQLDNFYLQTCRTLV